MESSKKTGGKKPPDGKEVMKRRLPNIPSLRPEKFESDPKKAYTTDQLAEIGAITLKWSQIEAHIDFIGSHILFAKVPFWLKISTDKALGTKAKLRLLKECVTNSKLMDKAAKACISDCFAQIEQCGPYRNAVIHHHIYDHENGIGFYEDESHSSYQILVSMEALSILYGILCSLLEELQEIDILFRIETDAQRPRRLDKSTGEFHSLGEDELRKSVIPNHTKRIQSIQKKRKECQKLPKFPDADLIRALSAQDDDCKN